MALDVRDKRIGRVLTPATLATALCEWAIRAPTDAVLDLGVGEGAFALAAFERLRGLGAGDTEAAGRVYGWERDPDVLERAQRSAVSRLGRRLPRLFCADFHRAVLPDVDAVVGNPPYIRRHYQEEAEELQDRFEVRNGGGLTDAYCYFLIRACRALRPGGRLAVVVSASWLDMKYGEDLKRLLLEAFSIRVILGFEGRVFPNALVKPVVVLAEKRRNDDAVSFAVLGARSSLAEIQTLLELPASSPVGPETSMVRVPQHDLSPALPWSSFLKAPDLHAAVLQAIPLVPLRAVADSRIGLQTFAKRFFILSKAEAAAWNIESEFLLPLCFSPRDFKSPIIARPEQTPYVVFACDRPTDQLRETGAGRYIEHAMSTVVQVRGKDETVIGFHRAPRLARANRVPWYNIRTSIERRGSFPILLPRRTFESYLVLHDRLGAVANEDFLEIRPLLGVPHVVPLLAFLNSSLGEFLVRSQGFQYGGGVFNLNPGAVRDLPVLDPASLSADQRAKIDTAWDTFLHHMPRNPDLGRGALDHALQEVLGMPAGLLPRVSAAVAAFRHSARAAGRAYRGDDPEPAQPLLLTQ